MMSQATTLSPAADSSQGRAQTACPAWCETDHADGGAHLGGMFELDLSLAEPGYIPMTDDVVSDFLTVDLWQGTDQDGPVICGLTSGLDDIELPFMTLDEAEALAEAILDLVRRGRAA
jgi:hypothetical protein